MKERISEAAVTEILQRGLRFSMRDLANRLGMSTKTLYVYFPSKEALISSLVDTSIQEMKAAEHKIMTDPDLSLTQKLRLALVNMPQGVAFGQVHLLQELKKQFPHQWEAVDEHLNQGWDYIRHLVQQGIATKELREFDVELFIQVYVGAMYQFMDYSLPANQRFTLEQALTETVDLLMSGILGPAS